MTGCTTIDVAKGVTKATQSLETSIKKIFESPDEKEKKQKISTEEEKQKIIVEEQKITDTDMHFSQLQSIHRLNVNPVARFVKNNEVTDLVTDFTEKKLFLNVSLK